MKYLTVWCALAASLLASAARAGDEAKPPTVIRPQWLHLPNGDDYAAYYPDATRAAKVYMDCKITSEGRLEQCVFPAVAPKGHGFEEATRKISKLWQMSLVDKDGRSTAGGDFYTIVVWKMRSGPDVPEATVTSPPWISAPSAQDIQAAFPAALGKTDHVLVTLDCTIADDGSLIGCHNPKGASQSSDLVTAAEKLAPKFRVDPTWRAKIDLFLDVSVPIQLASADSTVWTEPLKTIGLVSAPSAQLASSLYPEQAVKAGLEKGSASVDCSVADHGAPTDCVIVSESVPNVGFGAAAVQIAQHYVIQSWSEDGLPTEGRHVLLPVQLSRATKP